MIDAHQHYWHPARSDYGWMPKDEPVLSRPYAPADLAPALDRVGVSSTILVQAAPTVEETEYLLGIADATPSVVGIVGWIDFEDEGHRFHLERFSRHPKFKGVRPMIQDIPDEGWMLRDDVQWAFKAISDLGLVFDALGFPQHIENFLSLFRQYPDMTVVLDHCLKPRIADGEFDAWAEGMSALASKSGAYCKLSGLITEAAPNWSVDQLRSYSDHVLRCFGAGRVMWGSDWPVCRLRGEYDDWFQASLNLTNHLSSDERARVFGGAAAEAYRLGTPT
ncbi:MAG: amidohydrolase family protein [Pseudomonadota bacterium]